LDAAVLEDFPADFVPETFFGVEFSRGAGNGGETLPEAGARCSVGAASRVRRTLDLCHASGGMNGAIDIAGLLIAMVIARFS
jgi:hypothetical protein